MAAIVLVLVALTGLGLARAKVDTGIASFLPAADPAYRALEDKARSFGGDPVVVLLESRTPQAFFTDQDQLSRLVGTEGSLSRLPDVAAVYGPGTVLNQTAGTAQDVLAQISGRRDALRTEAEQKAQQRGASPAAVNAAGDAAVVDFDRRYGALLVRGLPAGLPTLHNPGFVRTVLFGDDGNPRPQWQFVVPNSSTVAVLVRPREGLDQSATGRLVDSVKSTVDESGLATRRVTVTGVPAITAALSDRAQQELPLLGGLSLAAVALLFFVVPWTRRRRNRFRPLLCSLAGGAVTIAVFGWIGHPLSLGVVAFLPILLGIGGDFPFYLSQPGKPRRILVAAGAAVAGFGALALSPLPFVRELGFALALGVAATVGIAVVARRVFGVTGLPAPSAPVAAARPVTRSRRALIAVVAAAGALGGLIALPHMAIQAEPEQLARGLPELADATYAERVLGSGGEVGIVLHGQNVLTPEVLRWTDQAQSEIVRAHGDQMRPVITTANLFRFLGANPTPEQIEAAMTLVPRYLTSAVVRSDRSESLMLFGVGITDVGELGRLLADVRASLPPAPPGVRAEVVGLPVAAVRGLDLVDSSRLWLNLAGVAAALLIIAVGLRRRGDVLRAAATVLLATGWVTGLAWLTVGSLSPLTVAVATLTTVTGCEFAVVLARLRDRRPGTVLRRVGVAALAATAGYLVLCLSGLAVLREFGFLLAAGVAGSFGAALLVAWLTSRTPARPVAGAVPVEKTKEEVTV
ncbi:RND transporter [Amycolatopsis sp. K13G38]|uniref:RND transporter n=2 Tax=Amycolatopsis acididurans TaxID=2724524 RepID=A0ABX1J5N0_9PSEU|nr:RND transporter [Amycolatopsis acididurans]